MYRPKYIISYIQADYHWRSGTNILSVIHRSFLARLTGHISLIWIPQYQWYYEWCMGHVLETCRHNISPVTYYYLVTCSSICHSIVSVIYRAQHRWEKIFFQLLKFCGNEISVRIVSELTWRRFAPPRSLWWVYMI